MSPGHRGNLPLAGTCLGLGVEAQCLAGLASLALRQATDTRASPPCRVWSSGCGGREDASGRGHSVTPPEPHLIPVTRSLRVSDGRRPTGKERSFCHRRPRP